MNVTSFEHLLSLCLVWKGFLFEKCEHKKYLENGIIVIFYQMTSNTNGIMIMEDIIMLIPAYLATSFILPFVRLT